MKLKVIFSVLSILAFAACSSDNENPVQGDYLGTWEVDTITDVVGENEVHVEPTFEKPKPTEHFQLVITGSSVEKLALKEGAVRVSIKKAKYVKAGRQLLMAGEKPKVEDLEILGVSENKLILKPINTNCDKFSCGLKKYIMKKMPAAKLFSKTAPSFLIPEKMTFKATTNTGEVFAEDDFETLAGKNDVKSSISCSLSDKTFSLDYSNGVSKEDQEKEGAQKVELSFSVRFESPVKGLGDSLEANKAKKALDSEKSSMKTFVTVSVQPQENVAFQSEKEKADCTYSIEQSGPMSDVTIKCESLSVGSKNELGFFSKAADEDASLSFEVSATCFN